jgi:hypothetical protein
MAGESDSNDQSIAICVLLGRMSQAIVWHAFTTAAPDDPPLADVRIWDAESQKRAQVCGLRAPLHEYPA